MLPDRTRGGGQRSEPRWADGNVDNYETGAVLRPAPPANRAFPTFFLRTRSVGRFSTCRDKHPSAGSGHE